MTDPNAAMRIFQEFARRERRRYRASPDCFMPTVYAHHLSFLTEALTRLPTPEGAIAAADLQLGPPSPGGSAWRPFSPKSFAVLEESDLVDAEDLAQFRAMEAMGLAAFFILTEDDRLAVLATDPNDDSEPPSIVAPTGLRE